MESEESGNKTHLDYSVHTPGERMACVKRIIEDDDVTQRERRRLKAMSDYLLFSNDAKLVPRERKVEYPIEGRNRTVTIEKRQTSLDAIVSSLETSPTSIYQLINSDRQLFLDVRDVITQEDIDSTPELRALFDVIVSLQSQMESSTGRDRYLLKRQMIETWQQMYLVRADRNHARVLSHALDMRKMDLPEHVSFDEEGMPYSDCIVSFFNPTHVSFLLEYYEALRHEVADDLMADMYWLLVDFEQLVRDAFRDDNRKMRLCLLKMLGYTNEEIDEEFGRWYGEHHTKQYYSMMWRHKIPEDIAMLARKRYVWWWFSQPENHAMWKKCTRCGRWLPAHPLYFRKNSSAHDGLYSVCRDCSSSRGRVRMNAGKAKE